jgi:hypothetical protein
MPVCHLKGLDCKSTIDEITFSPCPPFESGQDDEFTFPEEPVFADIEEHLEKAFAQASACRRAEGSP